MCLWYVKYKSYDGYSCLAIIMLILIDAYNILKQRAGNAVEVTDRERSDFLHKIRGYCKHKGHEPLVVFDGGSYQRPTTLPHHGVTVIYAGHRSTADEVLKDLIELNQRRDVLVVSSDREVAEHASRHNTPSIDAINFYDIVLGHKPAPLTVTLVKNKENARKYHAQEEYSGDLDAIMQAASKVVIRKDSPVNEHENNSQRRSSKQERRLLKVVKKL